MRISFYYTIILSSRSGHAQPRKGRPQGRAMEESKKKDNEVFNRTLIQRIVQTILSYKFAEKIVIFGSRAAGDSKNISDIDIAIFSKDWTDKDVNFAKHSLEENIKTPLKFDVVNFYDIQKEALKENILKKGKVIYESR